MLITLFTVVRNAPKKNTIFASVPATNKGIETQQSHSKGGPVLAYDIV